MKATLQLCDQFYSLGKVRLVKVVYVARAFVLHAPASGYANLITS